MGSDSIINLGENKIEWLQVFGLIPMCSFILFVYFLPDTPLYILENQGEDENYIEEKNPGMIIFLINFKLILDLFKSIKLYYGDLSHLTTIQEEAYERWSIDLTISEWDLLKKVENYKALIIGIFAAIGLAFTADDVIDSFSSQLFSVIF